jgi:hypothetical protein
MTLSLHLLLYFYGTFLIICGVVAVAFIGLKAKTALMSGGMSGAVNIVIGYMVSTGSSFAPWLGIIVSLALFIVFSWRSTKTLFKVFELIPTNHPDLNGKGIAFLIISLMAVVSVVVFMFQVVNALYPYST